MSCTTSFYSFIKLISIFLYHLILSFIYSFHSSFHCFIQSFILSVHFLLIWIHFIPFPFSESCNLSMFIQPFHFIHVIHPFHSIQTRFISSHFISFTPLNSISYILSFHVISFYSTPFHSIPSILHSFADSFIHSFIHSTKFNHPSIPLHVLFIISFHVLSRPSLH